MINLFINIPDGFISDITARTTIPLKELYYRGSPLNFTLTLMGSV
jgi:hypothetical protein